MLAIQDLRERMVYVVPIIVLNAVWSVYLLCMGEWDTRFLALNWILHLLIYIGMNHWNIWGGGDSDLFMLFGNICLFSTMVKSGYSIVIWECIFLCAGLILSIFINQVEKWIIGEKYKSKNGVAVIPGIAIVMIGLLVGGLYGRIV